VGRGVWGYPQHSATSWLGLKNPGRGLYEIFVGDGGLAGIVQETDVPGVDVAPSSPWLVGVERILAGEVGAEHILRRRIAGLPADRWDYLLIDCGPTLGMLTVNALAAVRELLVPVEAHVMAMAGLAQLLHTVEIVQERLNADSAGLGHPGLPGGQPHPPFPGSGGAAPGAFRKAGLSDGHPGKRPSG
jgi:chromosome partitioning protein